MVIHDQNGLLVPAKNSEALANAILQLIRDSDKAAELAGNAYRVAVENYSNKTMLSSYNKIFRAG
jgi:glycosyltransferase involved in cell wall biosynthesis